MKLVRIRFKNKDTEAQGFVELAKRVRVVAFSDDTYDVPKSSLHILDDLDIAYEVLSQEGFDSVRHALRDPVAANV